MCGIVGYIGKQNASPIIIEGLNKLEYRGYDSSGIAYLENDNIIIQKKTGKLENLKKHLQGQNIKSNICIGHTRWATHGGVTENNAHPHTDNQQKIALIHNGIFENYQTIKTELQNSGHHFHSQTDSEVLAHLISDIYEEKRKKHTSPDIKIFQESVSQALQQVEGGYAIVCMHKNFPNHMIAARLHNPLIIGVGQEENLVASDIPAILPHTKEVYNLQNGQLAVLTKNTVELFDLHQKKLPLKTRTINWTIKQAEKDGYPHFMIKEIHETPNVIRQILTNKLNHNQINSEALGLKDIDLSKIEKITFLACGSASYACQYARYLFEKWSNITCEVWFGSEYRYHEPIVNNKTLIIAVSQSGETADTLASIEKAKQGNPARIIGVINAIGSSMTREVDTTCKLQAGPEISVASTKAFSSMTTTLALMALYTAQERNTLTPQEINDFVHEIQNVPSYLQDILKNEKEIARIATFYIHHQSAYYIGRDVNYPSAQEGAQKLKEISYIHAEAYPAGELKHGPNAVIYDGFPIICLIPDSSTYKKMYSNIQEMKARDANILAIATQNNSQMEELAKHVIYHPPIKEELAPLLNTLVQQLFAYYVTLYKGYSIDNPRALEKSYPLPGQITDPPKSIDIDKPRNLAKSVTVE